MAVTVKYVGKGAAEKPRPTVRYVGTGAASTQVAQPAAAMAVPKKSGNKTATPGSTAAQTGGKGKDKFNGWDRHS